MWERDYPTLSLRNSGSDFCDTCTQLKNIIDILDVESVVESMKDTSREHMIATRGEFLHYKHLMNSAQEGCFDGSMHVIFDFAEIIIFTSFPSKAGQVKMDLSV